LGELGATYLSLSITLARLPADSCVSPVYWPFYLCPFNGKPSRVRSFSAQAGSNRGPWLWLTPKNSVVSSRVAAALRRPSCPTSRLKPSPPRAWTSGMRISMPCSSRNDKGGCLTAARDNTSRKWTSWMRPNPPRHCERSEAIHSSRAEGWIASLRSQRRQKPAPRDARSA
jgi:hypothetical protein